MIKSGILRWEIVLDPWGGPGVISRVLIRETQREV